VMFETTERSCPQCQAGLLRIGIDEKHVVHHCLANVLVLLSNPALNSKGLILREHAAGGHLYSVHCIHFLPRPLAMQRLCGCPEFAANIVGQEICPKILVEDEQNDLFTPFLSTEKKT